MKGFVSAAFEPGVPRKRLSGQLIWFLLWLAVTGVGLFLLKPSEAGHGTHTQLGLPPCPSVVMFDRPCPGCGMTTSWTATMRGNLARAFQVHPFGPILYLGFTATALMCFWGWATGHRVRSEDRFFNRAVTALLVVFLVFGVVRFIVTPMDSPYSYQYWKKYQGERKADSEGRALGEEGGEATRVPEDDGAREAVLPNKAE